MLSQLFEKIAKGQPLDSGEQLELINAGSTLDEVSRLVKSWSDGVNMVRPEKVGDGVLPGRPSMFYFYDLVNMISIPNSTWTAIDLTTLTKVSSLSPFITLDGKKIYTDALGGLVYMGLRGRIGWNTNGTGIRSIALAYYDSGGTLIARRSIDDKPSIGTTAGTPNNISITRPNSISSVYDSKEYFQIEAWQNSGGALGIYSVDLTMLLEWT